MLDFSPFKLVTEKVIGPDGKEYTLSSASAGAGIKYVAAQFGARPPGGADAPTDKVTDYEKVLTAEVVLISECLRDGDGDQVPVGFLLKEWPHAARAALHDWIVAHSPELTRRTRESLLREKDLIEQQLAGLEAGDDPKALASSGGASST